MTKISFIIPVYNTKKSLLSRCIESIKNINECEKEIIIIDDGSSNEETISLENELSSDIDIVLIKQDNKGPSAARNCGLRVVSGDYIVFLDSDDYLISDSFNRIFAETSKENYDILYFSHEPGNDNVSIIKSDSIDELTNQAKSQGLKFDYWVVWGKIYKKSIIQGCIFNEDIRYCEDVLFNMQVLKNAKNLCGISLHGIVHEKNEDSLCNRYNIHAAEYFGKTILEIESYCREDRKRRYYKEVIFNYYFRHVLPLQIFNKNNKASLWKKNITACDILFSEPYLHAFRGLEYNSLPLRHKIIYLLSKYRVIVLAYMLQ